MTGRLAGKIAVVVGAGQTPGATIGNGRAIALLFAREGATVVCVDRDIARAEETVVLIAAEGGSASAFAADIGDPGAGAAIVVAALDRHDRIDILVNNVGAGPATVPGDGAIHEADDIAFSRVLDINLSGMWRTIKAAIPPMRESGGGAIVNISSVASRVGDTMIGYLVSKAAVDRLTQATASANARFGIRCNAILPGLMDTPMAMDSVTQSTGRSEDDIRHARNSIVPLKGGMGTGWDTAYAALYLASDEARFVSGALLPVDGGMIVASTLGFSQPKPV